MDLPKLCTISQHIEYEQFEDNMEKKDIQECEVEHIYENLKLHQVTGVTENIKIVNKENLNTFMKFKF